MTLKKVRMILIIDKMVSTFHARLPSMPSFKKEERKTELVFLSRIVSSMGVAPILLLYIILLSHTTGFVGPTSLKSFKVKTS